MADITKMILMECITNLHVGDGDINYNIVDNEVQKDPLTKLPTIHSSGIKGAFRSFCESSLNEDSNIDWIKKVFGSPSSVKKDEDKNPGELKFFSGNCLALAMRNSGMNKNCKFPFSLVTTKDALKNMSYMMELFDIKDKSNSLINIDVSNIKDNTIESDSTNIYGKSRGIKSNNKIKLKGRPRPKKNNSIVNEYEAELENDDIDNIEDLLI